MKKLLSVFLIVVLFVSSFSSCGMLLESSEDTQKIYDDTKEFYNTVLENKKLLDAVATDVCTVLKDANYSLSTKQINEKIQKELSDNQKTVDKIINTNNEIDALFYNVKNGYASIQVAAVMNCYLEYYDSIIKADAALDSGGYLTIAFNKDKLDSALRNLYIVL